MPAPADPDVPAAATRNGSLRDRFGLDAVDVEVDGHLVVAASFSRRCVAHVIDASLIGVVQTSAFLAAFAPAIPELFSRVDDASHLPQAADRIAAAWDAVIDAFTGRWVQLVLALLAVWLLGGVYEVLMTRFRLGTLGKLMTGLATVDGRTLGRLSWRASVVRWGGPAVVSGVSIAMAVAQIFTVLGYGWAAFDERRRAVHDILSGSLVIERSTLPPQPPRP